MLAVEYFQHMEEAISRAITAGLGRIFHRGCCGRGTVTEDQIVGGLSFARSWSQFSVFGELLPNELVLGAEWKRPCRCRPIRLDLRYFKPSSAGEYQHNVADCTFSVRQFQLMEP